MIFPQGFLRFFSPATPLASADQVLMDILSSRTLDLRRLWNQASETDREVAAKTWGVSGTGTPKNGWLISMGKSIYKPMIRGVALV